TLMSDVVYALRMLRKSPGFAAVAILTLALGIGANSAIFSVLNGVVLQPLQYESSHELVRVASKFPTLGFEKFWISPPEYMELRERTRSFASFGAYRTGMSSVGGEEAPLRAVSAVATADLFETLGVPAHLGRPFNAEEDAPGGENVATLSYELWQSAFGGDADIVGRRIIVNGSDTRITGVMPPGFDVADARVEIWLPVQLDPANQENRASHFLDVIARLNPNTTLQQARAEMAVLLEGWDEANPEAHTPSPDNHPIYLTGLQDDLIGATRPALVLLLGAVGFVLLIACANVANLLLARAESRQKEIAVRAALGAGRGRLVRQFLTEGVVLSLIGGALGLFIGYAGVRLLLATNPRGIPRALEIGLDANVLLFTLLVSVVTGLIFGLAPALHLTKRTVTQSLRDGTGRTTAGGARQRVRRALVVSEVALAVVLVVGSSLMLRSFASLQSVDPGFDPDGLLSFQLFLPATSYPEPGDQAAFLERLTERLRSLPGVTSAAAMSGLPPRREVNANDTDFEGLAQTPESPAHNTDYWQFITRDYLETMDIPLRDGRLFTYADEAGGPVVLINERLANVFYPDVNPIGRRLRPPGDDVPWHTIVGVVKDVKQGGLEEPTGTEVYFLYPQTANQIGFAPRTMNLVVRTSGDPNQLASSVRSAVRDLDPQLPVANMASMNDVLHAAVAGPRFITLLLAVFAAVALALAAIGTYGVMAYSVAQRRQEIGIRMALGAQASSVLGMVLGQGVVVAAIGIALGVAGAWALTRLMSALLFNVSATDPLAFVSAPLLLAIVALTACYIPARRATRVDPAVVLKSD
ncbi:MAG TPA: ABC transporter permease, partial [Longimicrobiales bacterium]|nr:ABC transporter permease [Longimicrobiales bacterium]